MSKKLHFSFLSLLVGLALITVPRQTKADACADCETSFHSCNFACTEIGAGGGGCKLSCLLDHSTCRYENCPHQYALRNGSVYTMNFFRSNGGKIGSLSGWSPDALDVADSDFPITASYCDDLSQSYCQADDHYGYVIKDQGCYVLWYAGGYYTTDEVCYLKGEDASSSKNNEKMRPPFPSTPPPRSEETKRLHKKETAPLTPPASPTVKEAQKENPQPEKAVIPSPSKPSATVKEAPKENPQPRKEVVPATPKPSPAVKEVPSKERQHNEL